MRDKIKLLAAAFAVMLVLCMGVSAQKPDCSKMTEDQIAKAVYDKIKTKYEAQISHINVTVSYGAVTITGWATTKKIRDEIVKWAKKVSCVKSVNKDKFGVGLIESGGCGPGQKPCGDICIPEKQTCNICRPDIGGGECGD